MDSGIHWFDLAMIVVLILSGIWSLFRGFLREMLSLLGFVVVVTLAVYTYPYVFVALDGVVSENWVRQVVGMALVFIAAVALFVGFVKLGAVLTHAMGLSILDRLLGFCFGLLKVVVFVSLLFLVGNRFLPDLTILLTHTSILGPTFGYTAGLLERTILEQGVGVLEGPLITPEQLPALPELGLPEVVEPYVPDPFAPDDSAPDNGAPAPEPQ
jgi:membrane protein required for colicin V production